jgi:hypothetical protein
MARVRVYEVVAPLFERAVAEGDELLEIVCASTLSALCDGVAPRWAQSREAVLADISLRVERLRAKRAA